MPLPIAFLISGMIVRVVPESLSPAQYTLAIGLACAAVWIALEGVTRFRKGSDSYHYVCAIMLLTGLAVVADALGGQHLHKGSVLTAAGTAGARYYGIGNEFMGFALAAVLGFACLLQLRASVTAAIGLALVCALGIGSIGANAGGVITASTGFLLCLAGQRTRRLRFGLVAACFVTGVAIAIGFAFIDRFLAGPHASHLGSVVERTAEGGAGVLSAVVLRKADLAIASVLRIHGLFSLVGFAALSLAVFTGFRREIERVAHAYPGWRRWHSVSVPTALTAFIANDTGLVPMLIIYGACFMVGLTFRFSMGEAAQPPANAGPSSRLVE